jgi:membrane-associated phospholipid phosphatase
MVYATSAIYSGLATSDTSLTPLTGRLRGFPELPKQDANKRYDGTIAATYAERVVLDSLLREGLPTTLTSLHRLADSLEQSRRDGGVGDEERDRSRNIGREIGLAIVKWAHTDGFDATRGRPYTPPVGVGLWTNDAPANIYAAQNLSGASEFIALDNPANQLRTGNASDRNLILNRPKRANATVPAVNMAGTSEPYWGELKPFVLTGWEDCKIPDPPAYSTDTTSERYRDARTVVEAKRTQTPETKAIALFWADNAGESGTPVGHWFSIASQMVSERRLTVSDAARLMVAAASSQADAFIASWGYKYKYMTIRPRPYIRSVIDSTWEPLIGTPPFPEYPSGHSTQSASAAIVLTAMLGDTPFQDSTVVSLGHAVRKFSSFNAAAEEAGISRIYGGIHFPSANVQGRALGQCIGNKVVARLLGGHTH